MQIKTLFSKLLVVSSVAVGFTSSVFAAPLAYTREQLQQMTKEELIGIVLYLQGNTGGNCQRFSLENPKVGSIIIRVNHPGFNDDGTLKWPNGKVFLLRNAGFNNDRTLYYPNGQVVRLVNAGFNNDGMTYWSNGTVQRLVNQGFNNDGNITHADNSAWLIRNRGFSNDLQRAGAPTESLAGDGFTTTARLTPENGVATVTTVTGPGWTVNLRVNASAVDKAKDEIYYEECFPQR